MADEKDKKSSSKESKLNYWKQTISLGFEKLKNVVMDNGPKIFNYYVIQDILRMLNNHIAARNVRGWKRVVINYDGKDFSIDERIAPLVLKMFKCGINVTNGSGNHIPKNYVLLQVKSEKDIKKFLDVVFFGNKPTEHDYLRLADVGDDRWIFEPGFSILTGNEGVYEWIDHWFNLRFPVGDLGFVNERIDAYLINKKNEI